MDTARVCEQILESFFAAQSIVELWKACHCQMLWEAIKASDATIITLDEVKLRIRCSPFVYVLPEFLPALYLGIEPAYKMIPSTCLLMRDETPQNDLVPKQIDYFAVEPLYIVSCDYSWMIVVTPENTPAGETLCAFVKNSHRR